MPPYWLRQRWKVASAMPSFWQMAAIGWPALTATGEDL